MLDKYSRTEEGKEKYRIRGDDLEARHGYDKRKDFAKELKQAMADIHRINQEIEDKKRETVSQVDTEGSYDQTRVNSPFLDATTRDKLINLGQSLGKTEVAHKYRF